jgi:hypothetical protein
MANFFDQFDAPKQSDNFFDQFDAPQFEMSKAVTDIPAEMQRTAAGHMETIDRGLLNNPQKSAIGGLLDTGKGLVSAAMAIPDVLIGAPARSLFGHTLANTSHAIGGMVNPEVAAKDNPQQMYEDFRPGVDRAMAAISPRGASPVGPRTVPAPTPTAGALKKSAVDVWESPQTKSIQIPTGDVATLSQSIEGNLLNRGFRPTAGSAPGAFAEIKRMVPDPAVTAVSVDDMRAARRALGMTAKQRDPIGQATPDAVAARSAIEAIDNYLDRLSPALREANANYSAGKRADLLDYRSIQAQHRADKSGSGSNIENTMRQEVDKISSRGLSADEIAARDRIVEGSTTRNALRKVGKVGVSDGLSLILHSLAAPASGGMTIPLAVGGTVARKAGEILTRREIAALSELMRSRSPLAQQAPAITPQANRLAKALAASLLGRSAPNGMIPTLMPTYANQDQQ